MKNWQRIVKFLNQEQKKKIVDKYVNSCLTMRVIAKHFGISRISLIRILDEFNIKRSRHNHRLIIFEKKYQQLVINDYKGGMSMRLLAMKYKVSQDTIETLLRNNNIKLKNRRPRCFTDKQEKEIIEEYESGKTMQKLGDKHNVDLCTIRNVLKRNKIFIRHHRGITDELAEKIILDYNSGLTSREIGKKYGFNKSSILRLLKRKNIQRRKACTNYIAREKILHPKHYSEIILKYSEGMTLKELAEEQGVSDKLIRNILKENNVIKRPIGSILYSMEYRICYVCKKSRPLYEFSRRFVPDCRLQYGYVCYACSYHEYIKKKFGLEKEKIDALQKQRGGVCAICGGYETSVIKETLKYLFLDHDHETGKIRDFLCLTCNFGLGIFNENILIMDEAIKYLNDTSSVKNRVLYDFKNKGYIGDPIIKNSFHHNKNVRHVLSSKHINIDHYMYLLELQKDKCAICYNGDKKLCIDHIHGETGPLSIRGLLDNNCNTGLGLFYDTPKLIDAAVEYLIKHS